MSARTEPFAAGVPKSFNVVGNFFKIISASGATALSLSVKFFRDSRALNLDMDQCNAGDWVRAWPDGFDRFEITSTVAQNVTFQWLRGDAGSDRIVGVVTVDGIVSIAGMVSVVDGNKSRTLAGSAFIGAASTAPIAANYSHAQLWMPAGATRAILEQVRISSFGGCGPLFIGAATAALATLTGQGICKDIGAAAAVAQMRNEMNTSYLGPNAPFMSTEEIPPRTTAAPYIFHEPIVIRPGKGLQVGTASVNEEFAINFEWTEEPNV